MLDASLISALDERGKHRSQQIGQDLRRYYRLLAEGLLALRTRCSTEKLSLILEACNGWTMDPEAPRHLCKRSHTDLGKSLMPAV